MTTPHRTGASAGPRAGGPRRRRQVQGGAPLPLLVPALIGLAFLVLPLVALLG